ncbi:hypothetical protein ACFQFH_05485 [Halobaculum halobium]|uniref:Uncharacterized protein n=1 Tax=Halobaculum halobium TaxID=3032281 RepID=A0ABD5TDV0_9EURY|nr:hypothetical protein [Halobaculum sp. SYNS20]
MTDDGFDHSEIGVEDGHGTPLADATSDNGVDVRVVTLTDEQIEALANRELAIIKTDGHTLGLIHADRSDEAREATVQLAQARDAEFEETKVTERA